MRLHRFFVSTPISEKRFDISDRELIHQWRSVFRYNVGSQVILFDGTGSDHLAIVTSLRNAGATVEIIENMGDTPKIPKDVWLCLALIKNDNFELAVQKATELGVKNIIPVLCERSEKKKIRLDRLQKIAVEASEQSGRADVPKIYELMEFPKILDSDILPNNAIVLDLEGGSIDSFVKDLPTGQAGKKVKQLAIFIGPEGGWSERELEQFEKHNIPRISLGSQVLRAETAAIAVTSLLLL